MRSFISISVFSLVSINCIAQTNPITSFFSGANNNIIAVPFLMITPDARAAGMGETGVATSPDVNSIHWNAAKLAFADKKFSLGVSYTPWLRSLIPDANLAYISSYFKPDSVSAIGISMRYFSLGNIVMTDTLGNILAQYRPTELAFDACYSRRIAKHWSAGVAARFIYSNLANGISFYGQDTRAGKSAAGDLGIYYHNDDRIKILGKKITMMLGMAITNVGPKMNYMLSRDFIPMNLRLGQGVTVHLNAKNDLAVQYDLNESLVPSPKAKGPRTFSTGLEYSYNKIFFARTGYFYESPENGYRQYLTLGGGIKYNMFGLDFAYLVPTNGGRNPLQNTLRFSLLFEISKLQLHQMKAK